MENENPFGQFPQETFADPKASNEAQAAIPSAEPSRKRKSRRSKRTAAAPSPASSAKPQKRKYTRRAVTPVSQQKAPPIVGFSLEAIAAMRSLSEDEFKAVMVLAALGPASCQRVFAALQAVLPK